MSAATSDIEPIPFSANFPRYGPAVVAKLGRIERALGAIRAAAIISPAADQMRASALAGTVHYSTLIEGNELPLIEAERAAAHELDASTTAKIELVNYVEALQWLDDRQDAGTLQISNPLLLELHGVLMRRLGREESDFKPHHEGAWREGRAVIPDELLAEEYERVQAEVEQLNRLGLSSSGPVQLKPSQQRGLSALAVQGVREFTRAHYQDAAGVRRTVALGDLDDLVKKRIVRRLRGGSGTGYAFARGSDDRRGRPRSWTPERIQAELQVFCANRSQWPSVAEFKEAGRTPLYLAVNRYGGVDYWAERVGLSRR